MNLVMAKKTKKTQEPPVSIRPSDALREVLLKLARDERRPPAQMARILIEDALIARGLWPPSPQP